MGIYTRNGQPATEGTLRDLDRKVLRTVVWPDDDEPRNRKAYDLRFLRMFGTDAGLLLSQLVYWSERGHHPEGWIYKTTQEIIEEVGLDSRYAVEKARKTLEDEGVLEAQKMARRRRVDGELRVVQNSAVWHYRVNLAALAERLGLNHDDLADFEDIAF